MRFTAVLADFQKAINNTLPAIPRKSTLPILEHLNFSLSDNKLKIMATDQDITIMTYINVDSQEDGNILVPGKKIGDIIKALGSEGMVEFTADLDTCDIKIVTTSGRYSIKGLDADQYIDLPELFNSKKPDLESVSTDNSAVDNRETAFFKADEISKITEKTVFACSTDEFRMSMNGVFFQFRNNVLNSVATDSYRLVKVSLHKDPDTYPDELDVIIPQRTAELLKKSEDDVIFSLIRSNQKATHARFDSGNSVIITRLIDEKFPPYDTVIPKNNDLVAYVNHQDLLASLRRVSILTSKVSNQVRLSFTQGLLTITGEDEDAGDNASETISCNYNARNITIGFNCKYLEQALQNMHDYVNCQQVGISFSEPNRPVLIIPEPDNNDLVMLIMPVRV